MLRRFQRRGYNSAPIVVLGVSYHTRIVLTYAIREDAIWIVMAWFGSRTLPSGYTT